MKHFRILPLLMLLCSQLFCSAKLMAQQTQDKVYEFPISDPASPVMLEFDIHNGKVVIQGSQTDTVSIVASSRPLNEDEMANIKQHRRTYLPNTDADSNKKNSRSREGLTPVKSVAMNIKLQQRGNRIEVESQNMTTYVELVINVPTMTNVEGNLYRGEAISVNDVTGYLELSSWKGEINAERIKGPIVAETHQSSIVVTFAEFSDASPSSLNTHSGDIDITVANNMSANINVQNFQGEVLSGLSVPFEATEQVKRDERDDRRSVEIGGQMTARLNGGGQDLTLTTYSGGVYVRKP